MAWHDFEVSHGNEETFREMLRVKRSGGVLLRELQRGRAGGARVETLTEEATLETIAEREDMALEKEWRWRRSN